MVEWYWKWTHQSVRFHRSKTFQNMTFYTFVLDLLILSIIHNLVPIRNYFPIPRSPRLSDGELHVPMVPLRRKWVIFYYFVCSHACQDRAIHQWVVQRSRWGPVIHTCIKRWNNKRSGKCTSKRVLGTESYVMYSSMYLSHQCRVQAVNAICKIYGLLMLRIGGAYWEMQGRSRLSTRA